MFQEPPAPLPPTPGTSVQAEAPAAPLYDERADGTLVIDLMRLVPPRPEEECVDEAADPLNPVIIVCDAVGRTSHRLGPQVGPVDDFAIAIPRARIKLSENAEAEANLIKQGVGGFDADGAEVKLKIDF